MILCLLLLLVSGEGLASPQRPIIVFGDSLSSAYRIESANGWVHLLEDRLHQAGIDRPVVNASIAGETTAGGLARLPQLLSTRRPALVIIELGANDGLRGLPIEEIRGNLQRMIAMCREAGAKVVLLGIELPINYGPRYRDGLRTVYRDLATKFNVPLVPFLLEGVALDPDLMQEDGLHPNARGEPKVLDHVWPVLEAAITGLRDKSRSAHAERPSL